jgi:hypothetical protein
MINLLDMWMNSTCSLEEFSIIAKKVGFTEEEIEAFFKEEGLK